MVGPNDSNILSLSSVELYCKKFMGHVRSLKKYKCVRWKVWLRLSIIDVQRSRWLCRKWMFWGAYCHYMLNYRAHSYVRLSSGIAAW